jgi:hypothetical protein
MFLQVRLVGQGPHAGFPPVIPPMVHSDTPIGPHRVHNVVHRLWGSALTVPRADPNVAGDEAPGRHAGLQGEGRPE